MQQEEEMSTLTRHALSASPCRIRPCISLSRCYVTDESHFANGGQLDCKAGYTTIDLTSQHPTREYAELGQ